jgi:hypothetical protein
MEDLMEKGGIEEAPANGKESPHFAHSNEINK